MAADPREKFPPSTMALEDGDSIMFKDPEKVPYLSSISDLSI